MSTIKGIINETTITWVNKGLKFKIGESSNKYFQLLDKWNIDGCDYCVFYCELLKGFTELVMENGEIVDYSDVILPNRDLLHKCAKRIPYKDLYIYDGYLSKKRKFPKVDLNNHKTFEYIGYLFPYDENLLDSLQLLKHIISNYPKLMGDAFDFESTETIYNIKETDHYEKSLAIHSLINRLKQARKRYRNKTANGIIELVAKDDSEAEFAKTILDNKKRK